MNTTYNQDLEDLLFILNNLWDGDERIRDTTIDALIVIRNKLSFNLLQGKWNVNGQG